MFLGAGLLCHNPEVEEMCQEVKRLPHKPDDLRSISRTYTLKKPVKHGGGSLQSWCWEGEGRWEQMDPCPASLTYLVISKLKTLSQKEKKKKSKYV